MRAFPYLTLAKLDRAASHQLTSYRVPADSKMEEKLCVGLNPVDYCKSSLVSVTKSFNITKDTYDAETMSAIARTTINRSV